MEDGHGSSDQIPRFLKNTYEMGFRKVASETWEFANDNFVRGQPHLMNNIHRKKTLDSHSLQNTHGQGAATPLSEIERQNLNDIIENLKHDNEHILLEIQTREEEKKIHETQLNYSKEHLKVLEQKQQSMLYSVGHALHKPEIECLIWSPVENTQRKRRYPRNSPFGNEARTQNLVENSQSIGIVIPHLVAPEPNVVVSPDPISTETEVTIAANNLGAIEQTVLNAHDLVSPEPSVVVVPDNVSPKRSTYRNVPCYYRMNRKISVSMVKLVDLGGTKSLNHLPNPKRMSRYYSNKENWWKWIIPFIHQVINEDVVQDDIDEEFQEEDVDDEFLEDNLSDEFQEDDLDDQFQEDDLDDEIQEDDIGDEDDLADELQDKLE
ncbi:hypothetical protein MTR_2g043940 [Medicago truncatula]|uniref:Uncharacterized protein n=1 Tax=Medicago truncatula TaxID=3880 RepID=A0A072V6D7_MEDTR|nr:hypothetical protein MTR_2g043940 [Medicago truncatula]